MKDRCRKADPLPVSLRQLRNRSKKDVIDARLVDGIGDGGPGRSGIEHTELGGVLQVLHDQHLLIQRVGLGQISESRLGGREIAADRHLIVEDAALIGLQRTGEHPHGRRLAGAVGPEKSDDLAHIDLEVEVFHGDEFTESFGHTLNGDHSFPFLSRVRSAQKNPGRRLNITTAPITPSPRTLSDPSFGRGGRILERAIGVVHTARDVGRALPSTRPWSGAGSHPARVGRASPPVGTVSSVLHFPCMNHGSGGSSTPQQLNDAVRRGTRVAAIGVVVSAVLATTKIAAGVIGNSFALVADGVESVLDIFSGLLVWGGLRVSALPQSDRYPYGLGKAEPLASLVVSTVLLLAAVGIAIGATQEIMSPQEVPESFTLVVLIGVLIAKEVMFRVLSTHGREIGSQSLNTDAWHHRSDALTSLAAFIGISVALTAGEGFESADDWAALVACAVITYNGVRLFRASLREVLDVTAPNEIRDRIREIAESVPGVDGVDLLRVRQSGLALWVDIHVEVEGEISVREGHHIAHLVKDGLLHSDLRILDALVHIEPRPDPQPDSVTSGRI